jgi:predicted transcriptional regulator
MILGISRYAVAYYLRMPRKSWACARLSKRRHMQLQKDKSTIKAAVPHNYG